MQRVEHALRRQRQLAETGAGGIGDGVADRRRDADQRRLADALGAERAGGLRVLDDHGDDVMG